MKLEIKDSESENENSDEEYEESESEIPPSKEEKRIAELEKTSQEYLDKLKRLQAEFENYKKRCAKEREQIVGLASERIVKQLLDLLDDFERAMTNSRSPSGQLALRSALDMMYKQLKDILRREGVVEINTDCKLDPFEHEVMSKTNKTGKDDGEIVECLQKGYKMGNRVIRPARVVVSQKTDETDDEEEEKEESDDDDQRKSVRFFDEYIDTDE